MPNTPDADAEWLRTVAAMSEHSCGQVFSINIERLRAIAERLEKMVDATPIVPMTLNGFANECAAFLAPDWNIDMSLELGSVVVVLTDADGDDVLIDCHEESSIEEQCKAAINQSRVAEGLDPLNWDTNAVVK